MKFFPNKSTKDFKAHQNLMMVVTPHGSLEPVPRGWAQWLVNPGEQTLVFKYHKFGSSLTGLVCRLLTFGVFWGGCALLAKFSLLNVSSVNLSTNPLYHQFSHIEFLLYHSFKKGMKRTANSLLLSSSKPPMQTAAIELLKLWLATMCAQLLEIWRGNDWLGNLQGFHTSQDREVFSYTKPGGGGYIVSKQFHGSPQKQ